MTNKRIKNLIDQQLDMPQHKVHYALMTGLLQGAYDGLTRYGIELNDETFQLFFDAVGEKLSGTPEIEYEWSDTEYNQMMIIKQNAK